MLTKEDYNTEPVFFCSSCLSLGIQELEENINFCPNCGSTDVLEDSIDIWTEKYKEQYGEDLLNN